MERSFGHRCRHQLRSRYLWTKQPNIFLKEASMSLKQKFKDLYRMMTFRIHHRIIQQVQTNKENDLHQACPHHPYHSVQVPVQPVGSVHEIPRANRMRHHRNLPFLHPPHQAGPYPHLKRRRETRICSYFRRSSVRRMQWTSSSLTTRHRHGTTLACQPRKPIRCTRKACRL